MIEHPIPQHVTGYQFHLVGDMTLKQFLELAGGIVAAWFIWTLGIPSFIKWPLAVLAAITGFALAFMPLEERPLDHWFLAFFKAVYRPTLLVWKKSPRQDILRFKPQKTETDTGESVAKIPLTGLKTLLEVYELSTEAEAEKDPLEKKWLGKQKLIPGLFNEVQIPKKLAVETTFPKKLPVSQPSTFKSQLTLRPLGQPTNPTAVLRGEITLPPRIPAIPRQHRVKVKREPKTRQPPTETKPEPTTRAITLTPTALPSTPIPDSQRQTPTAAATNPLLPLPVVPDQPNILSGMVLTSDGQIVENAIIEIRQLPNYLPVRAVKTNQLGQFTIATPLLKGSYELEIEKDNLSFDILKIETEDKIIPPIEIRAK